ncbi:MAG: hypothetical protein QGF46_04440 [Planctomycetota bacterium]|jgi:hypothetical protein|nr:hypothetical protein [Planctomycetota bacterium]
MGIYDLLFVAFFVLLHIAFLNLPRANFNRAFKLSRGVAAAILSIIGFYGLLADLSQWRSAFIYHQNPDAPLTVTLHFCMLICMGHFVADLLWLLWGKLRYSISPRKDLIIHHGIGVLAFGYALQHELAYAACLITMASELMPVTTGFAAYGQRVQNMNIVKQANRWRLLLLVWWRVPLWSVMAILSVLALIDGGYPDDLLVPYLIATSGFIGLLLLDRFWIKKCLATEEEQARASG